MVRLRAALRRLRARALAAEAERDELRALLCSPAIGRVLDRARDHAEDEAPRRDVDAANPRLVFRAHYARFATEAREEIAAIEALRRAVAPAA